MIKESIENNATIFVVVGEISPDYVIEYMKERYSRKPEVNKNVIWDLNLAEVKDYSTTNAFKLITFLKDFDSWGSRICGYTAYVAEDDVMFGLLRMYHAYLEIENIPVNVNVFRTRTEAYQWFERKKQSPPKRRMLKAS